MDLHGDGNLDLISGSWPGEIFIFRGGPGRSFAPPEMIKDRWGEPINVGGGVSEEGNRVLVTGSGEYVETAEGTAIRYHGRLVKIPKGKRAGITGTASTVHAFDWNGDGLIDLLIGDIEGNVYLVPNEGTAKAYAFGKPEQLQAGGKPLRVVGDAGPFVADWDGDGKPDLLVGAGDGSVTLFRNVGTRQKPVLAAGEILVPPGVSDWENPPRNARRGVRSKICVVDWNGDGRLDLLVGDMATQKADLPPLTPEQQAECEKLKKERDAVVAKYVELNKRLDRGSTDDEEKKLEGQMAELRKRLGEIDGKLPKESDDHGWVWLFLRKPAAAGPQLR